MIVRLVSRLMCKAATWAVERFYEVGRLGGAIPGGSTLVIANHPNSLVDGVVVMKIAGRRVRPLARAPLFDQALVGHVLRGLGALPVYRPQDFPGETWRNEDTFKAAIEALLQREAVLIFPEGLSHSEARLSRMKTGAARIALQAEEASDWSLGLQVVPVGLTYQRKHTFRGRVAVAVGRPFHVIGWRQMLRDGEWAAVESLTAAMREALEKVTLNLPSHEDRDLIEAAERLWSAEKRLARPRERAALARRLPRLQRFAEGVAWLRTERPEQYARLAVAVRTYRQRLSRLGVGEGDVPERFRPLNVVRYALVEGLVLLVGLPLAVFGTLAWYIPYQSPRLSMRLYQPAHELVATVKLATALLAFPLTYLFWLTAAWLGSGLPGLTVTAAVLPVAGFTALWWRDRWGMAREDARIFWRAVRRRALREQLAGRRESLAREFDEVARLWQDERRRRETRGPAWR